MNKSNGMIFLDENFGKGTVMQVFAPLTEGEKVPDGKVSELFLAPPGAPERFLKSAFIVGARGSGKTMLLRYQKEQHEGVALYLALSTVLAPVTTMYGQGQLAYDVPADLRLPMPGMAVSLLALELAERAARRISLNREATDAFIDCLPAVLQKIDRNISVSEIGNLKRLVATLEFDHFAGISQTRPLTKFVAMIGKQFQDMDGRLLLLLDKADQVSPASLGPVIELLDQSENFLALAAFRPGVTSRSVEELSRIIIPGDHYDVIHLGQYPRSLEWKKFVIEAVKSQLRFYGLDETRLGSIPSEIQEWIVLLSRDSIRTALELFAGALSGSTDELLKAASVQRENLVTASRASTPPFVDLKDIVNTIRSEIGTPKAGSLEIPADLLIEPNLQTPLFETTSILNRFIEGNLRCAAFSMPEGERWRPGIHPLEVEVAPLLLWKTADEFRVLQRKSPRVVRRSEPELKALRKGGPPLPPTIFVAYDFGWTPSKNFRRSIESDAKRFNPLQGYTIVDGHLHVGASDWAKKIRDRIRAAKAVIADVTNLRPDVLFEMGFAFGLRKAVLAVAETEGRLRALPEWLTASQMGHYGDKLGMHSILTGLSVHIADPQFSSTSLKNLSPVPAMTYWLGSGISPPAREQLAFTLTKSGLKLQEASNFHDQTQVSRIARAGLLIACLDRSEFDAFVHYICGAIIAKPGVAPNARMRRRIILLCPPGSDPKQIVAQSLSRCADTVTIARIDNLAPAYEAAAAYGEEFRRFSESPKARERKTRAATK